jgi:hypothetical protein
VERSGTVLQFDTNRWIDIEQADPPVAMRGGLVTHNAVISVKITVGSGFPAGTVLVLDAEVAMAEGNRWLGNTSTSRMPLYPHPTNRSLSLPLTNEQLLRLEDARRGRDLDLIVRYEAWLPDLDGGREIATYHGRVTVAASRWQEQLEGLGLGVGFTVTVPLPFRDGELKAAGECIRKARRHLNDGQYDAAIGEVRRAVERAKPLAQWPGISKNDDPRQRSQDQRWEAIRKAVFDQASGATHDDDVTKTFVYSREETEALIGMAAGLLRAVPVPQS